MSARSRLFLDLAMLTALLTAYTPSATGVAIHEWLGIVLVVPLLFHLIINWEWTVCVATRFFERIRNASRLNLVVDTLLFASAAAVTLSGLMISRVALPFLGLSVTPSAAWIALHSVTADTTVALLLVHFALHASWAAKTLGALGARPQTRPTAQPHARAHSTARSLRHTGAVLVATGLVAAAVFAGVGLSGTATSGTATTATTATTAATVTTADTATSGGEAASVTTASNSASSELLVCPATGCTETTCHAVTGQAPGGH